MSDRPPPPPLPWSWPSSSSCVVLIVCTLLAACGGEPGDTSGSRTSAPSDASPAPLVGQDCLVVLLDALHAPHLGCYGARGDVSPAIDRLASLGTRFTRATSQSSWTLPSTVSLFTGAYQETHGVTFGAGVEPVRLADQAVTLAERFADAGYGTACFTQNPFAGRHWGLDQGFETFEEVRSDGTDLTAVVLDHLATSEDRARFVYAHFRRPHTPYDPDEQWSEPFLDASYDGPITGTDEDIEAHNSGRRAMSGADLVRQRGLYAGNIRQVDDAVQRLLQGIDRTRTLVVLLSDHGEAFGQHGRMGHNWLSYQEYVHIPLIVAHPRLRRGAVVDVPAMTVDVVPTLVELLGLPGDGQLAHGRSLVPWLMGPDAAGPTSADGRPVFTSSRVDAAGRRQLAATDGQLKYVREEPSGREQLFDLERDPGERNDLAAERAPDVERWRGVVDEWQAGQRPLLVTAADGDLDEDTKQRLRDLGYLIDR